MTFETDKEADPMTRAFSGWTDGKIVERAFKVFEEEIIENVRLIPEFEMWKLSTAIKVDLLSVIHQQHSLDLDLNGLFLDLCENADGPLRLHLDIEAAAKEARVLSEADRAEIIEKWRSIIQIVRHAWARDGRSDG